MRFCAALCLLFVALLAVSGCSSSPHSFLNGDHFASHFTCIYYDLDRFHMDLDRCVFGIDEPEDDLRIVAD
jgi:hypothetical protein